MTTRHVYDWNQQHGGHVSHGGASELHSVYGQVHAGPHSIPAHADNGIDVGGAVNNDSGAFVTAGTAGHEGFDVRTLGLTEQELREAGLHPSTINSGRQLPLDQYKINYDPNPIIIRKQIPVEMPTYKQQVIVRYLRPPTPPEPGPLIVKEVREPQPAAAPPLVIRTRAPREKTPPPIVIREAPPQAPHIDTNPRYVTRVVRHNESYSSQPQHPQFETIGNNNTFNFDPYTAHSNENQFNTATSSANYYGEQKPTAWITELVSSNGATTAAPAHLIDDIYRAINNQLPRV